MRRRDEQTLPVLLGHHSVFPAAALEGVGQGEFWIHGVEFFFSCLVSVVPQSDEIARRRFSASPSIILGADAYVWLGVYGRTER